MHEYLEQRRHSKLGGFPVAFHRRTAGLTTQTGTGLADFGAQAKWHKSFPVIRKKENSPGLQQPGSFFILPHHYKGNAFHYFGYLKPSLRQEVLIRVPQNSLEKEGTSL